ncbi:MAG: FkbM family methyltransferase [Alphaproteobacteria bacterium]|nr:MAG: FkbM family methyltransferase [Alphaproteobacteria bacterium]
MHLRSGPILEFDYPDQFPPTLMMFGDLIDPEFSFLRQVARPGWRVVDVGAAIGQFSLFAATCLPGASVDAFEPSSANVETLNRNLVRNRVEGRVRVHRAALSNRKETARFATAPKTWMSQLVAPDSGDAGTEEVAVDTLDATLDQLELDHVDVLKINVAGFEPAVMEGAMRSLRAGRVDILVLLLGLPSLPHYAAIAALGYRFFYYHPAKRMLFEVGQFDADSVLGHRPWPARHILAIRDAAVAGLIAGRVELFSPRGEVVMGGELTGPPPNGAMD